MNIGGYEVVRLLGKGGMSEVYEVESVRLGSRHALKLFTYEKDDREVRGRFLVEGRLLARLSHPRIVKVTDLGTDEASGSPYFVMDLVLDADGATKALSDVEPGSVDEEVVGRWYDDLREGLGYIHAHGVIHRDLKLQNVLIGPDGHAVLTDFGISKVFDAQGDGVKIVDTVQTIVKVRDGRNLVMGSIGYMAPELEMGVAASRQSDWYALGVIVYRLLTGTWCDSRTDVLAALDGYDPVWRRIIPKLLHSNPNARECLSYADEKRSDREAAEAAWEARWLKEKGRGHFARHIARYVGLATVLLSIGFGFMVMKYQIDRRLWRTERRLAVGERSPYGFNGLFRIPAEAKEDDTVDADGNVVIPSAEDLSAARIDALVLTHDLFSRLNAGEMTLEAAIDELTKLRDGFSDDADEVFDDWPEGYMQNGTDEALYWLLNEAVEKLEELAET